ncbi:hypothetical protein EG328_010078 [Venturia inaequalis]|uniref:Uncharacterized protein n=1 Tax=Venturia inaequalis TaxID=5025 RepID=A0A8H3YLH4_VENIN|nr:hypothetical protein EG328_010078 [Venturia inaequalis]
MNNLESSFGQLNMGLQNQGTQNNGPAVDGLDELTNQMNGFSIRQPQKLGDVVYDIQILHKLSRYICQNHRTNRWSNIPATTVEEQELRVREFQEKRAYEELEEGFEEVYGENFSMILSIIRQKSIFNLPETPHIAVRKALLLPLSKQIHPSSAMVTSNKKRHRECDDSDDMEGDRKIARLETPFAMMDQDQNRNRDTATEYSTPTWDSLADRMQHFSLVSYPPPSTVEDAPGAEKGQSIGVHVQDLEDFYQKTKTNRIQNFNNFISRAKPEPRVELDMRDIQAEVSDDDEPRKNDCDLLADLNTLHQLDRADDGIQKLLDPETVAVLQQGFHSIYRMTLTEAVKIADEELCNLIQEANKKADGKMRRCWWKYVENLDLFQSLEMPWRYSS